MGLLVKVLRLIYYLAFGRFFNFELLIFSLFGCIFLRKIDWIWFSFYLSFLRTLCHCSCFSVVVSIFFYDLAARRRLFVHFMFQSRRNKACLDSELHCKFCNLSD